MIGGSRGKACGRLTGADGHKGSIGPRRVEARPQARKVSVTRETDESCRVKLSAFGGGLVEGKEHPVDHHHQVQPSTAWPPDDCGSPTRDRGAGPMEEAGAEFNGKGSRSLLQAAQGLREEAQI